MGFKEWLREWEGNKFSQEKDLVNDKDYPRSRYKGPGDNYDGSLKNTGPLPFKPAKKLFGKILPHRNLSRYG